LLEAESNANKSESKSMKKETDALRKSVEAMTISNLALAMVTVSVSDSFRYLRCIHCYQYLCQMLPMSEP
jgi:hypothetical protein